MSYICNFILIEDEDNYQYRYNFIGAASGRQRRPVTTRIYQATVTADHGYPASPVNPGSLSSPWKCVRRKLTRDPDNPLFKTMMEVWEQPNGAWEDDS